MKVYKFVLRSVVAGLVLSMVGVASAGDNGVVKGKVIFKGDAPKRGVIKAVGNGRLLDTGERGTMQVKKNQEVLFTSYAGTEVKVSGDEYLIMDESDILGVVG